MNYHVNFQVAQGEFHSSVIWYIFCLNCVKRPVLFSSSRILSLPVASVTWQIFFLSSPYAAHSKHPVKGVFILQSHRDHHHIACRLSVWSRTLSLTVTICNRSISYIPLLCYKFIDNEFIGPALALCRLQLHSGPLECSLMRYAHCNSYSSCGDEFLDRLCAARSRMKFIALIEPRFLLRKKNTSTW